MNEQHNDDIKKLFQELSESDEPHESNTAFDRWLDDHWVWLTYIALFAIAAGGAIVLKALGI